jgi:O-antigen ligase
MTWLVRVARAGGAAVLLVALGTAVASRVVPWPVLVLGAGALVGGLWRPALALPWVLAAMPWGERLAPVPVRASELVMWAFWAGLCLRVTEPRLPASAFWRRLAWPALLFAGVVIASWVRVELQQPGAAAGASAAFTLLRLVPSDYLVTAGRAPHTAAMLQAVLGAAVFLIVPALARRDPAVPRQVLFAVAVAGLAAAVLTVVAVPVIYLSTGDWNEIDRYISVTRSRGAFHLKDVNAAGSQYILAGLLSLVLAPAGRRARLAWRVAQVALLVALWMSGSRAAITAGALGLVVWAVSVWLAGRGLGAPRLSARTLGACGLVVIAALTGSVRLGNEQATTGSASLSLSIRGEFLETSRRMIATAPLTGVGIGTYYERSSQFMPPALRAIYGNENAHNYFLQVWAEVGLLGLLVFLWWLGRALGAGWTRVRNEGWRGLPFAAVCACGVYLLTCVTGHPFLVVETAVPFWAALGATAALDAELY